MYQKIKVHVILMFCYDLDIISCSSIKKGLMHLYVLYV